MRDLAKQKGIIITTTDKGGAVVIMDTENYITEANRRLSDENNYSTLQTDPIIQHNKMLNDALNGFKNRNLLSKKTTQGMKVINQKTPTFYITTKIHKEHNPGIPVSNSINYCTSEISPFVDHNSQPLVREFPSYIKDFVTKTNNFKVPENLLLVTMDKIGLHTNIPNNEGIAAVKRKHDNFTQKTVATKVITTFLALILTLNNFTFNSKFYLQIKGCAMGTICSTAYANILVSEFEERYIYPLIKNKSSSYLRFIDDIFMVRTKSESEITSFLNEINKKIIP